MNIKLINGEIAELLENEKFKLLRSENYNYIFHKDNGFFARWGKTEEDDGDIDQSLPEIIDMEISTVCHGIDKPCKFCYKSNTSHGEYMTFDIFKNIFHKLPPTITQLAAGIGDIDGNPDVWKIFEYCRDNGVVPNITINGARMTPEHFDNLAKYCGAVAVSVYDKELTYNAIQELTSRGMSQVNIHFMLANETYDKAFEVMTDIKTDPRLAKLNAMVFLSLKTKGNAKSGYNQLSQERFNHIVDYAFAKEISIGFDSCSSQKFFTFLDGNKEFTEDFKKNMYQCVEKCEASCYSSYINVRGIYFPCSFCECVDGWEDGINVLNCNDFLQDVWFNEKTLKFKNKLISCDRNCPIYTI